jgi:hypothetical protein
MIESNRVEDYLHASFELPRVVSLAYLLAPCKLYDETYMSHSCTLGGLAPNNIGKFGAQKV